MMKDNLLSVVLKNYNIDKSPQVLDHIQKHSSRVAWISQRFSKFLGLTSEEVQELILLGRYHDIGKIGVPEHILLKPGKLSSDEVILMREHSLLGSIYVLGMKDCGCMSNRIRHHHERWDGCGYPDGLKQTTIPFQSRLISIVDAFEAMTSERCYRKALTIDQALEELVVNAGKQFDPQLTQLFLDYIQMAYHTEGLIIMREEALSSLENVL